jgi:hypothetical protein
MVELYRICQLKESNQARSERKKKSTDREGYRTRESGGIHPILKENEKKCAFK